MMEERGPTQVEVAISKPQIFIAHLCINGKRQDFRPVENGERCGHNFDFAGCELRVPGSLEAQRNFARNPYDVLTAQTVSLGDCLRCFFGPEDRLRESFPVAQIYEDHAAVIPPRVNPTGKCDFSPYVGLSKFVTVMSA